MRPLVILRSQPGASATARLARQLGMVPMVAPLFEIRPLEWEVPDPSGFDGLLLTSANALRSGGDRLDRLRALPAYCVGEATAAAAREAGFKVALTGSGGVDSLLAEIPGKLRLLHLCGAERREPGSTDHAIVTIPVYRAAELGETRLDGIEDAVVALHSPRAGEAFSRRAEEAGLDRERIAIVAMSAEAAETAGSGWERVEIAVDRSDSALLAIAARLCDKAR